MGATSLTLAPLCRAGVFEVGIVEEFPGEFLQSPGHHLTDPLGGAFETLFVRPGEHPPDLFRDSH